MNGLDKDKLTAKQKKELISLISYLHTFRFLHQIGTYGTEEDRELFESSFIRYSYDKADLTQEEVNAILTILGDMPTKTGIFPLVMKIKVQADALIAAEQKEQEAAQ